MTPATVNFVGYRVNDESEVKCNRSLVSESAIADLLPNALTSF